MGKKIVLTGVTLTDSDAPTLVDIDPIESEGSLVLIEPAHPAGAWDAGVPANGTGVTNLFTTNAGTVAGGGTVNFVRGSGWDGSTGVIERTTKGGLHTITSPTLATSANERSYLEINAALKDYLFATTNDIYMSVWARVTQVRTGTMMVGGLTSNASPSNNYLVYLSLGSALPTGRAAAKVLGGQIGNAHASAWTGTKPSPVANMLATSWYGGWSPFLFSDALVRTASSVAFYRWYVEDLTVSGRTYAEVDAIDHELYTQHILTSGGRYYGDTYTDPATVT